MSEEKAVYKQELGAEVHVDDYGLGADPVASAYFDQLVELTEEFTTNNRMGWYAAMGVLAVFSRYMMDLMIHGGGE